MDTQAFIQFLRGELGLSQHSVDLALSHCEQATNLPIVLWQYGFVSLAQLDQIFDWMFEEPKPIG